MKTFDLLLSSINDVKDFVNIVSKYDFDVDLTSGR
ncbi:MAG: HPr family phosphocarrier protein, partial [Eubacterium sp.]